jgi:hypothetical protein
MCEQVCELISIQDLDSSIDAIYNHAFYIIVFKTWK